jgi:hypothetical protein
MSAKIIEADLDRDGAQIAKALSEYLNPLANGARFEWLYACNPHGRTKAWVALDDDGNLVATAAAFPRRVYIEGKKYEAWVLGDFCVQDSFRTIGPALQLQRKCLADLEAAGAAFCYDFPSRGMLAIYRRMGLAPSMEMIRFAKLLTVDRQIAKFVKSQYMARSISAPLNKLLDLYGTKNLADGTLTFSVHEGTCRDEFSHLAESIASSTGICIDRSAEYLNWRYRANSSYSYEIITARRAGVLVGYCVFYEAEQDATVVDLFGLKKDAVIAGLICAVEDHLKRRGVAVLSVPAAEKHPFVPLLRALGFAHREKSPIMTVISKPSLHNVLCNSDWLLMAGDRDS